MNKDIDLPSGAKLHISLAPFAAGKALYQAVLEEARDLRINDDAEVDVNLFKDLFCAGFSSKKIDKALDECMKKATYNSVKVSSDTFEPMEAREDYLDVCWEVAQFNLLPFTKSLMRQFSALSALKLPSRESK